MPEETLDIIPVQHEEESGSRLHIFFEQPSKLIFTVKPTIEFNLDTFRKLNKCPEPS